MSDTVISVNNLSKSYLVGHQSAERERYVTLRDIIQRESRNFVRKATDLVRGRMIVQGDELEEFWALKDVNFEIKQGEAIGIIGRNGAGKSTLLKILSRITEPTKGRVLLRGRVASLLEVGTGFHAELTGRENIFLNGAILGMTQREIRKKFDEIVAFAEVERFLDTPVKRFSSGMYVRLAFAVAAHLEPEILIVDEVLAVGDAEFQKKCLGKMSEVARENRTVLFVSHNMGAVKALTQRCILLEKGSVAAFDGTENVISEYLTKAFKIDESAEQPKDLNLFRQRRFDNPPAKIVGIVATDSIGNSDTQTIKLGDKFAIEIRLLVRSSLPMADLGIVLKTSQGDCVTALAASDSNYALRLEPGCHNVKVRLDGLPLAPGRYLVDVGLDPIIDGYSCDEICDYPLLTVVNEGQIRHWLNRPKGVVHCQTAEWATSVSQSGPLPINASST